MPSHDGVDLAASRPRWFLGAGLVLVAAVATLDFYTPADFISAIIYTIPLFLIAELRSTRLVWLATG